MTSSDLDDFNPYQPPEAPISALPLAREPEQGRGVWSEGMTLVMAKDAQLPRRCVSCNAPATFLLRRSISRFHPTLLALLLLPGLGPYLLITLLVIMRITSKYAFLTIYQRHRARRLRNILIGLFVAFAGAALCVAPVFLHRDLWLLTGLGFAISSVGVIFSMTKARVLSLRKSTPTHAWLDRAAAVYLDSLPSTPMTDSPPDFEF